MKTTIPLKTENTLYFAIILTVVGSIKIFLLFSVNAIEPDRIFSPDSVSYVNTAKAFLATGNFAVNLDTPEIPQIERTPGYPFFVASIYFLGGESYPPLILSQILISLGTIVVTYLIANFFWGTKIAVISAFFLSLDFASFVNSQKVLTDTLFTFVFTLAVIVGICALQNSRYTLWLTCLHGILVALATMIRPISYYVIFPISLTFIIIFKWNFSWKWKKIILTLCLLLLPCGILIGGWQIRNDMVAGSPRFSNVVGWNLLFCRAAGIIAERDHMSYEEARQQLGYGRYSELYPETKDWSIAQLDRLWQKNGVHIIRQHPWLYLKSQIRGLYKMLLGTGWRELLRYILGTSSWEETLQGGPGVDLLKLPFTVYIKKWLKENPEFFILYFFAESILILLYISVLLSLWQLIRIRNSLWHIHFFIWSIIVYLIVISVSVGPEAYFRFRIPIIPLLSVYAGHGMSQIISIFNQQTRKILHSKNNAY